jgi:hypothetical protein
VVNHLNFSMMAAAVIWTPLCQELLKTGSPSEIETSRGGGIRFGGIIMESVNRAGDFARKNIASISGRCFSGGFDPRLPSAGTHGELEALTWENSEI